jgi:hypothetical protein
MRDSAENVKAGKKFLYRRMMQERRDSHFVGIGVGKYRMERTLRPTNHGLAGWVEEQRNLYRKGKLTQEQIMSLEALGVVWTHEAAEWETRFAELQRYRTTHDDCLVPAGWATSPMLAQWVGHQRSLFRKGRLSEDRSRRLLDIGFVFDVEKLRWEKMYPQLVAFNEKHGHGNVPEYLKNRRKAEEGRETTRSRLRLIDSGER